MGFATGSKDTSSRSDTTISTIYGAPQGKVVPPSLPVLLAAFYVALFIIRPWEQLFPGLGTIRFERIYAILMIAVAFLSASSFPQTKRQDAAVLFFLFTLVITSLLGIDPTHSWDTIYIYITLIIFYFVLLKVIDNPYELVFMAISYILAMGLYLGKSLWEYFIHGAGEWEMGVYRLTGINITHGDPNSVAPSILYSLPILVFLFNTRHMITCEWPTFWQKLFTKGLLIYTVIALASLILTRSRGGFVGLVFFVVLLALHKKGIIKKFARFIGLLALCLFGFMLLPSDIQDRYRTLWAEDAGPKNAYQSASGRWEGFIAGVEMWKHNPLTGVGPGNFASYHQLYLKGPATQAHNLIGQTLGETGLLGISGFFIMIVVVWLNYKQTQKLTSNNRDPTQIVLSRFTMACRDIILLLLFSGLHGHNLYRFNWLWVAAFCSLALNFAYNRAAELKESPAVES